MQVQQVYVMMIASETAGKHHKHDLILGEEKASSLLSSQSTLFLETSLLLSTFPVLLSNLQLQYTMIRTSQYHTVSQYKY